MSALPETTGNDIFPPTRWSQVLVAQGDDTKAAGALNELCRAYWQPIYGYLRRRASGPEEAQDWTQDYFASLIRRDYLKKASEDIGRLRAFLLADVKFFLNNARRANAAEKRGGSAVIVPLDVEWAERHHQTTLHSRLTDEHVFDRTWALRTLEQARQRLADEYTRSGRGAIFTALSAWIDKSPSRADYEVIAAEAAINGADNAKVALSRLRSRLGSALRAVVTETLSEPGDVEDEIKHLFRVLASSGCQA